MIHQHVANLKSSAGDPKVAAAPPEVFLRGEPLGARGFRETLSRLSPGETAIVSRISPECQGEERRRLIALGILPLTRITAEIVSPSGDPTAYRIRGALFALRREQAELIETTRGSAPTSA